MHLLEPIKTLVVVALCLCFVRAEPTCKDELPLPPSTIPVSSLFMHGFYSSHGDKQDIVVRVDTLEECATFCVQLTDAGIFNCTGFRYEAKGECVVQRSSWCKKDDNSSINSARGYILKVYNFTECINNTSSSLSISPTSTLQVALQSTVTNLHNQTDTSSFIIINITATLLDVRWDDSLLNASSSAFNNLSTSIKYNIYQLHKNDHVLRDVYILHYRNSSWNVEVSFSIYYNESVSMDRFRALYRSLYKENSLYNLSVRTVSDNLPGKPPSNIIISHYNDGTAVLSWTHSYTNAKMATLGYRVKYQHDNTTETTIIGYRTHVRLKTLKPLTNYIIHVMTITTKGFGEPSLLLTTMTSARAVLPMVLNFTIVLNDHEWNNDLLNKSHPDYISLGKQLRHNIQSMYQNASSLVGISIYTFKAQDTNGSDSLVEARIGISYLKAFDMDILYEALYKTNRLGNISVLRLDDNIPGKPVTNIKWKSTSPQSIKVSWSQSSSLQCGSVVFYRLNSSKDSQNMTLNSSVKETTITNLLSLSHYVIWIQSITASGLGMRSDVISAVTMEKLVKVDLQLVVNETWAKNKTRDGKCDYLKTAVIKLFVNQSQFRSITCLSRNVSDDVVVDATIQFGQDVKMRLFVILYHAVYIAGHIGNTTVQAISDNIPGKPVSDYSAIPTGTTTIKVTWSDKDNSSDWLIYYNLVDANNVTLKNATLLVDKGANETTLVELKKFAYYLIWIQSVTPWGHGIPSRKILVRTLEEVLPVQLTLALPKMTWFPDFLNRSSELFINESKFIKYNIEKLHQNNTDLKTVEVVKFINGTKPQVEISLVYGQFVKSAELNMLYHSIHKIGKLNELTVEPIKDNVPGKPPTNITATANTTTSVLLTWSPLSIRVGVPVLRYQVSYVLTQSSDDVMNITVEANKTIVLISGLQKFRNYTFWVTCVTRIGVGIRSEAAYERTLEEFVPIQLSVRFPSLTWNANLSFPGSIAFRQLCSTIKYNVMNIYSESEQTQLRNVRCHQFRNGSVLANLSIIYGQHVNMSHFASLYKALYIEGRLYNITIEPLNDNVPGKPPVNVSAIVNSSTSIDISWACADCHITNDTIGFLVSYRPRDTNVTTSIMVNVSSRHVILTGLEKFTSYEMVVMSVTSRGTGLASLLVYRKTLEDEPSKAPSTVIAFNTSSTSIAVTWGEVPIGYLHGILQGYVIQYKKLQNLANNNWTTFTISANISNATITSLDKYTHYVIKVMAFTVVGRGPSRNVTVSTDEDVPSQPPSDIKARNISSTAIEVTWKTVPSGFAHGVVIGYHVLYRRANDSNSTYTMTTVLAHVNMTLQLTGLNKFTEYRLKLMAYTRKGNGTESNEISVHTDEDTPSLPPPRVQAYNISSTSLNVTWGRIIPSYFIHGILRGYRVQYRKTNDVNGSYSDVTTLRNDYELTGLDKYTVYTVMVLAFTSKGDGVASTAFNVSTDEDVPSQPPVNLLGHNTSSTSLYITWDPVPHGFVHGILLGYKVFYRNANNHSQNYTNIVTLNTTRVAVLENLAKFTKYTISVLSFTGKGDGPMADSITVTTDEDIPSLHPRNLQAHNTSSTSLLVYWDPVPKAHVHGILRGYRVFYKMADDVSSSYANVSSFTESARISGLKKYTIYNVKVLAFTIKGDGPVTKNISISTDEDVPSLPPNNVRSHNTSSNTLNVTWSDIPSAFVHGILLGYRVIYSIHQRRSERSLGQGLMIATVTSPNVYTIVLKGLENYTEYNIQVLGYTRIGDGTRSNVIRVTTDENVPGKPPTALVGNNASSTSIRVEWKPVPQGFVYGILRGYRVMYRIKSQGSFITKTLGRNTLSVLLSGLLKYTYYDIKILAFTRIGNGVVSSIIQVQTDEDIPSKAPLSVSPSNKVNSMQIPIKWRHIPQQYVHGRLRGYHIKYKLIELADNPVIDHVYQIKEVWPNATNVTLTKLESYATYEIQIAGFTSKGDGVWEKFSGTTCRCHAHLPTNWFAHPPYVRDDSKTKVNESTFNNVVTDIKGIFPPILHAAVKKCCAECAIDSPLNFRTKGDKKTGIIQVKENINNKSYISFPIGGIKGQTTYQGHQPGVFEFVSVMDMPGAAFIIADRRQIHTQVLFAILGCWPTVVFVFLAAYLAGIVIWIIDVRFNPLHFPRSFVAGSWEGFWWSFITMTTVGYGDRIPKSVPARLFTVVWIWIGIVTIAVLTSSITASLMSMVFRTEVKLYGTKVAAIDNSSEYKLGVRRNANLDTGRKYGNISEIYKDLEDERVHAALLDSYATASAKDMFSQKWLRVRDVISTGFESTYGVVLGGDAMKLGHCMRDYMRAESSQISRVVQNNVDSIKASKIPPAVKRSSDLLTAESELFKLTAKILGGLLALLVCVSLLWEHYRIRKIKKKQKKKNNNRDLEGSWPFWAKLPAIQRYEITKAQYKQEMDNFYNSFKAAYDLLRKKHTTQIKALKNQERILHQFSLSEWTGGRSATYSVTQDGDVNSILDGLDMSMFDRKDLDKKNKGGL